MTRKPLEKYTALTNWSKKFYLDPENLCFERKFAEVEMKKGKR